MIEINLLPKDLKPANNTPKPRFATIIIGVIIMTGLGMWYINITTIDIPQLERKRVATSQEISLRQVELSQYLKLEAQKKQFTLRRTTVQNLIESRISFEKLLDEICDLLSPTDIWFTSLNAQKPITSLRRRLPVTPNAKNKGTPILKLDMTCNIQAPNDVRIKKVAEFFESFKYNPYFSQNFILPTFTGLTLKDKEAHFKITTTLLKPKKQIKRRPLTHGGIK